MAEKMVGTGSSELVPTHDSEYDAEVYPATFDKPVLDILVPSHAHVDLTMACLKALYLFTKTPFHVIVLNDDPLADYGMTETYLRRLQRDKPNLTYIHSNIPFKDGNTFFNLGLKYCRTEYMATVMNSVTVEAYWEIAALEIMKRDPLVGSIGFKCLFPSGIIESAGIAFMGHLPTDIGRDEPGYKFNEVREAEAVQWAFALHRRKALEGNLETGIFNGHVGWDDIDNCLCLKKKGWKIVYCGQGIGIHQPRSTRGSNSVDAFLRNQENSHVFFKRWGLWNTYLEASKMDVANILKHETKDKLSEGITTIQVLRGLLKQAEDGIRPMVDSALKELGVEPGKYLLEMNPQQNVWMLKVNSGQEPKITPEAVKPASDTEQAPALLNATEEVKV